MPYIPEYDRKKIDPLIDALVRRAEQLSVGELNYVITKVLISRFPRVYADYNQIIGVLECVKLEFYRRYVAEYEQSKLRENGDITTNFGT